MQISQAYTVINYSVTVSLICWWNTCARLYIWRWQI